MGLSPSVTGDFFISIPEAILSETHTFNVFLPVQIMPLGKYGRCLAGLNFAAVENPGTAPGGKGSGPFLA